jgi:two-component system, NtrC family, sensor kinase
MKENCSKLVYPTLKWPLFLLIEQNNDIRITIRRFLEISGHTVEEADNRQEAIASLKKCLPNLIFLDIEIEGDDGLSICRELKELSEGEKIPIILIIPDELSISEKQIRMAGASDWITKPILWGDFSDRLRRLGFYVTEYKLKEYSCGLTLSNWEEVFNAVQDPILLVTPGGIITEVNPATLLAARKTREEIIGKGACQILHGGKLPHIKCPLEELLSDKSRDIQETRLPGLFGDYLLTVSPIRKMDGDVKQIMLIARSLTKEEVRKVEAIRTAQLAAIGELAAGVAHEINNPINGIINYAQLLVDDGDSSADLDILRRIISEGERISRIAHNLLSFARDSEKNSDEVSMEMVIEDCMSLVNHQLKKDGIKVDIDFEGQLPVVFGNANQLQQVLLNLLSNSRYALNQKFPLPESWKRIMINSFVVEIDSKNYVRTAITDWGIGIPQGVLARLFDPFFSTKPAGEGTGLGLSISHGIIRDHNGVMRVDSVLNNYTVITIDIPVFERVKHG